MSTQAAVPINSPNEESTPAAVGSNNPSKVDEQWKAPSERCTKEDLQTYHKHNVRFPEEWTISKFAFAAKPYEKASVYGKKIWINHPDAPFRCDENMMGVVLPQMRVMYAGESQDEATMKGKGFKMSLSADSSIYHVEGNDQNNFVTFAENFDKHVVKYAFDNKDVWFKGDADKLDEERDVWKRYMPIADYGAVGGDHPNPWLDADEKEVDAKTFKGDKHRKYGPKFWFGLSKSWNKKTSVWNDHEFECEFMDGYTGKTMDITPLNFKEFMEANKNIKAQGIFAVKWIQLLKETFKVKLELIRVHFFPKSSRPKMEAEPIPSGLGLSIPTSSKFVDDEKPVVDETVTVTDSAPSAAAAVAKPDDQVKIEASPLVMPSKQPGTVTLSQDDSASKAALEAGTMLPPAAVASSTPQNDAEYLESLKRGAHDVENKEEKKNTTKKTKIK